MASGTSASPIAVVQACPAALFKKTLAELLAYTCITHGN
jgi:hypothetical protein